MDIRRKTRSQVPQVVAAAIFLALAFGAVDLPSFTRSSPTPLKRVIVSANPPLTPAEIKVGSSVIEVSFADGALDLQEPQILEWVTTAARAAAAYYGRFPVARTRLRIFPAAGETGVFHGTTFGPETPFTRISVGEHTTASELSKDWMMTHELIHIAFPQVADEHHWIEEGIATYVEPIARAQLGTLSAAQIWGDMARDMPKGEPGSGDRGLDRTHTWGRTYWGGAMFCLVADVRIRERTQNKKGLQDALRGIVNAGGTIQYDWPIEKAFQVGDQATGTQVLTELYGEMKDSPVKVDLAAMWKQLGVVPQGRSVVFDESAPLAAVRRAITQPRETLREPGP